MRIKLLAATLLCLLAGAITSSAQSPFLQTPNWREVRKLQPGELQLKMTLPKDHFYQGEIINAALEFSNTSATPYHVWIGTSDRSGRITDTAFFANDATGVPVVDPLKWYFMMGGFGGGLGNYKELGNWSITLPANQWLRFDKPGVYTLFAWSNRVQKGEIAHSPERAVLVPLVSDKVQITIDPLPPDAEKQIIAQAREKIASGGKPAGEAIEQLRYLGTPAAGAELIPLLSNEATAFDAILGLCAAPDPGAEAGTILAAVRQGKLPLQGEVVFLYSSLNAYDLLMKFVAAQPDSPEARQLAQEITPAMNQARDEITAAALSASGGKGPAYIQALLTKFQENNRDPAARAALVQHQLELSVEQAISLLEGWDNLGGEDFLPLARKMAGAPTFSVAALGALVKSKPDEARALLIADASRPKSGFFSSSNGSFGMGRLHLPPAPIPELDSVLRGRLAINVNAETLFYLDELGSVALLPDAIAVYQAHEGKWACEIERRFLQYWLRCDPKGGLEALTRALQARESTGCFRTVLEQVLGERWTPGAMPLVVQSLDDPDEEVVLSAVRVLEIHADSSYIDKSLSALERLQAASAAGAATPVAMFRGRPASIARQLLVSKNWHYTPEQQKRLQAIAHGK